MLGAIRYSLGRDRDGLGQLSLRDERIEVLLRKALDILRDHLEERAERLRAGHISSSSRPSCGPTNVFIMSLPSDWQSPFRPPAPPCPRSARAAVSRRPQLLGCN